MAHALAGPVWLRAAALIAVTLAALVMLSAAARSAAAGAHGLLSRLVDEGLLDPALRTLHPRFGTPSRLIDATAVAQLGIVLVSGGEVVWLARVYAVGLAGARC